MKHPIAVTRNGAQVYVELIGSDVAQQISRNPRLLMLVKELLEQTDATTPEVRLEHDMGRKIGTSAVVETTDKDVVYYAMRPKETVYARFVKNKAATASQHLTVIMLRDADGEYELRETWIGQLRPYPPGSDRAADDSKSYWSTHAFVSDGEMVQPRSITKDCPY